MYIPMQEDVSVGRASDQLVELFRHVASILGGDYSCELGELKEAGIKANPWNRTISWGINPKTKNKMILINKPWFDQRPQAEQEFLIAKGLLAINYQSNPALSKIISIKQAVVFTRLVLCIIVGTLGFSLFQGIAVFENSKWGWFASLAITYFGTVVFDKLIATKVQTYLDLKLSFDFDSTVNKLAAGEKLQNKKAGVGALRALDISIKAAIAEGEEGLDIYKNIFAKQAQALSR